MVLKVVTGKILETLELLGLPVARGSPFGTAGKPDRGSRLRLHLLGRGGWCGSGYGPVRLSKNTDSLADNLVVSILSGMRERDQEESGQAEELVPKLGI